ncbi:hypothetical protein X943_003383 [Babesia divergens]|uniref:MACPF domain-containing protein n=1 Tax=Babesia divergens TaxID=32595 RepID=A0AAD9GEA7_BABDI|nr:hypothetical protein X943_003383 [Babesia divergens]
MKTPNILIAITAICFVYVASCVYVRHVSSTLREQRYKNNAPSLQPLHSAPPEQGNKTVHTGDNKHRPPVYVDVVPDHAYEKDVTNVEVDELPLQSPVPTEGDGQQKRSIQPSSKQSIATDTDKIEGDSDTKEHGTFDERSLESCKQIKGLEYLGIGYDITKSKPFGDEETYVDTGYTQPIIKFTWESHTNSSGAGAPTNVWVRREPACHRGHTAREIESKESIELIVAEDVTSTIGAGLISINHDGHKNSTKQVSGAVKHGKFVLKSQCAVLTAGMLLSVEWDVTSAFRSALKPLLGFPNKDMCHSTKGYQGSGPCTEYYNLWKRFFNSYGTHVISRISMGGKVLHITDNDIVKKEEAKQKTRDTTTNISLGLVKANVETNQEYETALRSTSDQNTSKVFIMGGDTFIDVNTKDGWKNWVESVELNSMPIKIHLAPISNFIPPEIRKDFWYTFNFYKHRT